MEDDTHTLTLPHVTSIETSDLEFQRGRSEPESLPSLTSRADYADKYNTRHHLLGSREEGKTQMMKKQNKHRI